MAAMIAGMMLQLKSGQIAIGNERRNLAVVAGDLETLKYWVWDLKRVETKTEMLKMNSLVCPETSNRVT
jgi:hypothetical protein